MSQRWRWAIAATEMNDLVQLARLLTGAVLEAAGEGAMPHLDPAVKLISYQIALAGNGDLPTQLLYDKIFDYCDAMAGHGPNFEYLHGDKDAVPPEIKSH